MSKHNGFILTEEKLKEMFDEAFDIVTDFVPKIYLDKVNIKEWSVHTNNSKVSAGTCNNDLKAIKISKNVAKIRGYEHVMNTLIHEILHICAPDCYHDGLWLELATIFNNSDVTETYRYNYGRITSTYTKTYEQLHNHKYKILCTYCDEVIAYYHRKCKAVKDVENYNKGKTHTPYCACGVCGREDLELIVSS